VAVGAASAWLIHDAVSDLDLSPVLRITISALSGTGIAYVHHRMDAPVADLFASLAA
jgi:hypothetical protein